MKTEFVSKNEFIPVKKAVTDHKTTIEGWNPMLIHHNNEIKKIVLITEQLINLTKASGPAGATGEKGNPGSIMCFFKTKVDIILAGFFV